MSDLRKFNQTSTTSMASEPIRDTHLNSDVQDKSGLSSFHHIDDSDDSSNTGRIAGALVVALLIGGAGIYAYSSYSQSPSAPKQVAAATPPASVQTAPAPQPADNSALQNSPYAGAAAAAPAPKSNDVAPASTEKPVKPIRSHIARADKTNEAQENVAEASQTAQLNRAADQATQNGSVPVPLPQAPSPPASSVASNNQDGVTSSDTQDISPAPAMTPDQPAPTTVAPTPPVQSSAQDNPAPALPQ